MKKVIYKIDPKEEERCRKELKDYLQRLKDDGEKIVSKEEEGNKVTIKIK